MTRKKKQSGRTVGLFSPVWNARGRWGVGRGEDEGGGGGGGGGRGAGGGGGGGSTVVVVFHPRRSGAAHGCLVAAAGT